MSLTIRTTWHAQRTRAKTRDRPSRPERLVREQRAVERLKPVAGRVTKRDRTGNKALIGERSRLALYRDTCALQRRGQHVWCRRITTSQPKYCSSRSFVSTIRRWRRSSNRNPREDTERTTSCVPIWLVANADQSSRSGAPMPNSRMPERPCRCLPMRPRWASCGRPRSGDGDGRGHAAEAANRGMRGTRRYRLRARSTHRL